MENQEKKRKFRLIPQVLILFAIAILVTGIITFVTEHTISEQTIRGQIEAFASEIAEEAVTAVREYPASDWLISYWYTHADEMEIEYDAEYGPGTVTEAKSRLLSEHCPGIQLKYADRGAVEALDPEDQKLYAEVAYSWLITRMNEIKRSYRIDFLFCVVSDSTCLSQFFLLSASDPGAVRGTSYEEVYPLGHTVTVGPDQQEAMRRAAENVSHLANAGSYVDYYTWFTEVQGQPVYIGITYNLSDIRATAAAEARRETLYAMLFQVFLSLVCLVLIYRFVLRPLKKVQENIRLYKQTKDSAAIMEKMKAVRSHNEIGDLSEDVTALAAEMDNYVSRMETITAERERISTELSLATRIQAAMMPHIFPPFPDRCEFDIYASMDPAKEVGGDFYDFFLVDDDHLCMVMADVSGKGVPAALFMMASKIILQSCAMLGGSPAEILTKTNEAICSNNQEEMFITVWLGILEISTGRLTAANAGHEYPVLQKTPGGPFELLKDRHGFVLGGMAEMKYREYELQMTPGTKLFLYTDGVPEAADADGKMFGMARMLAALNEEPGAEPEQVLEHVRAAADGFVKDAEQFDDLTMLCMVYRGPQGDPAELETDAAVQNLQQVQDFVDRRLEDTGCPGKTRLQVATAVEEVFVNIAQYAYQPGTGSVKVQAEVRGEPERLFLTFTDRGVPFDPLQKPDPDVTLGAEERGIGGLGIFMTKRIMDAVSYEYRDGCNVLVLEKNLEP
ncbi:MAG: SpoIIE family protein phosphatase [Lachnospiraceae bacterium]|nr:SpoIIE family protein phosphatase [Lachnospiraceae bacterium]